MAFLQLSGPELGIGALVVVFVIQIVFDFEAISLLKDLFRR